LNWPREDGKLFLNTGIENNLAVICSSDNVSSDFQKYSKGYKMSADLLTKYVINEAEISKLDTYFFPITFLYRQSIELIMKAIFFNENQEKEIREVFLFDTSHDLSLIWNEILPYIKEKNVEFAGLLEWIEKNINNIVKFDELSDAFRYPNTKDLNLFFKEEKRLNLRNLAENMNYLYIFFENFIKGNSFSNLKEVVDRNPLVFVEGGSYYEFSHIGWSCDVEYHFYTYIKGYKECADFLVDKIEDKDIMVFPICFLYRNLLELLIKNILINYSSLTTIEIKKALNNKNHKLISLWNLIEEDISKVPHDDENKTLKYVKKYLEEFHQKDLKSDKFRYPINISIENHFDSPEKIDIINLKLCLDELYNFFNGVTEVLMRKKELKQKMRREYSSYNEYY
jgi:hypothetical protein